jgi:mRNA interferase MazF
MPIWKGLLPMESLKQGNVFWVNFDPSVGAEVKKVRPAVVVSNDINNEHSPIVSIAPITSNVTRVYSFEVEIPAGTANLTSRSKIMVNQTRAVDKVRLVEFIGSLPAALLAKVKEALGLHYDITG